MKKRNWLLIGLLCIGSITMAQNEQSGQMRSMPNPQEMAVRRTNRMAKELSLSDAQKAAVLKLNQDFAEKMAPKVRKESGDNDGQEMQKPDQTQMEKMRKERKAVMTEYNTQLKAILTPDQYNQYSKMRKSHGPKNRPDNQQ